MEWQWSEFTEDQPGSPNERWVPGASSFSREFILKTADFTSRAQAAYDILGYCVLQNGGPYGYIQRIPPMPYPGIAPGAIRGPVTGVFGAPPIPPNFSNQFYAVGLSKTRPVGVSTGISLSAPGGALPSHYNKARISAEFSVLPYQVATDAALMAVDGVDPYGFPDEGTALAKSGWLHTRYIGKQPDSFSRLIQFPFGYTYVRGIENKVGTPVREGGKSIKYIWYRVPIVSPAFDLYQTKVDRSLGTLNNATFDFMETGTVLLDSYGHRQYQGAFGEWLADVTLNMVYLPHPATGYEDQIIQVAGTTITVQKGVVVQAGTPMGWNSMYDIWQNPTTGQLLRGYSILTIDKAQTTPILAYSDFSTLFRYNP